MSEKPSERKRLYDLVEAPVTVRTGPKDAVEQLEEEEVRDLVSQARKLRLDTLIHERQERLDAAKKAREGGIATRSLVQTSGSAPFVITPEVAKMMAEMSDDQRQKFVESMAMMNAMGRSTQDPNQNQMAMAMMMMWTRQNPQSSPAQAADAAKVILDGVKLGMEMQRSGQSQQQITNPLEMVKVMGELIGTFDNKIATAVNAAKEPSIFEKILTDQNAFERLRTFFGAQSAGASQADIEVARIDAQTRIGVETLRAEREGRNLEFNRGLVAEERRWKAIEGIFAGPVGMALQGLGTGAATRISGQPQGYQQTPNYQPPQGQTVRQTPPVTPPPQTGQPAAQAPTGPQAPSTPSPQQVDNSAAPLPALESLQCRNCGQTFYVSQGVELTTCPGCVPPGTIILGDNKTIEALEVGDSVAGLEGLTDVKETFNRPYYGPVVVIDGCGLLPLRLTPEHPVLTVTGHEIRRNRHNRRRRIKFGVPTWKPAENISTGRIYDGDSRDYLVVPRVKGTVNSAELDLNPYTSERGRATARGQGYPLTLPFDEDSAWLLGLYVAEGSSTAKGPELYLGKHEGDLAQKIMMIARKWGYSPYISQKTTAMAVGIPSRLLARALPDWCGSGARNKRIPDFILYHKDERLLTSFLTGYLDGDGYSRPEKPHIRNANTVSQILALQLQLLATRLGYTSGISAYEGKTHLIGDRSVSGHTIYCVIITMRRTSKPKYKMRIMDDFMLVPVFGVTKECHHGTVHNLHTRDESYLVSNAVVHNCHRLVGSDEAIKSLTDVTQREIERQVQERLAAQPQRPVIRHTVAPPESLPETKPETGTAEAKDEQQEQQQPGDDAPTSQGTDT